MTSLLVYVESGDSPHTFPVERAVVSRKTFDQYDIYRAPASTNFTTGTSGGSSAITLNFREYQQRDYYWKYVPGYEGVYQKSLDWVGCGYTSLAIVINGLTGDDSVTPDKVIDDLYEWNNNNSDAIYVSGSGSPDSIFQDNEFMQKYYGLIVKESGLEVSDEEQIISAVEGGDCAILSEYRTLGCYGSNNR